MVMAGFIFLHLQKNTINLMNHANNLGRFYFGGIYQNKTANSPNINLHQNFNIPAILLP